MIKCQYCTNPEIEEVLYLGALPPVNDMRSTFEDQLNVKTFPLPFCHCENCGLTQIGVSLRREVVFPDSYPYLSGMTKSLLENFADQAYQVIKYLDLKSDDLVLDIGSNDGSLLSNYKKTSKVVGIEPTQAADAANSQGIPTLKKYFDEDSVNQIISEYGKARLVTACNVFAHIGDISSLLKNIDSVLAEHGVFVSESHYLVNLVETLQFDTIYHEHLRYYTVTFLEKMFGDFGFEIFRVDPIPSHGGSIRVWASRKGAHKIDTSVENFKEIEEKAKVIDIETLHQFSKRVISWRNDFRLLIAELIGLGAKIGALGAPSRASTLITFAGLTELDVVGVGEVPNSSKIGKNMPGTRIPVITENELLIKGPTHLLLLSWHIQEPIMKALRQKGFKGSFIIPLPSPRVID